MSNEKKSQRLGILGGTFDPIHLGHLLLAEQAREALGLDKVRFIPAFRSPLKLEQEPWAEDRQRLEMVQLAISGNPHFELDDRELRRGGTSFTVDTLAELSAELPSAELVFLMGADSLSDFHRWREPTRICELAFVAVLARGGHPSPDLDLLSPYLPSRQQNNLAAHQIEMPQVEISSSDIRARISEDRSVKYQLQPAVQAYIQAHSLYQMESA